MDDAAGPGTGEAAFASIVREHGDAVFGLALRRTGDRTLAEDLAQESFLRAWRARDTYRGDASVRGWLLAIAANVVTDHMRRRRRRPAEAPQERAESIPEAGADPALRVEHAQAIERLRGALARLPERHREMFLLRERDGLSYKEIASVLRCPIGSVMSGLARARERLIEAVEA